MITQIKQCSNGFGYGQRFNGFWKSVTSSDSCSTFLYHWVHQKYRFGAVHCLISVKNLFFLFDGHKTVLYFRYMIYVFGFPTRVSGFKTTNSCSRSAHLFQTSWFGFTKNIGSERFKSLGSGSHKALVYHSLYICSITHYICSNNSCSTWSNSSNISSVAPFV